MNRNSKYAAPQMFASIVFTLVTRQSWKSASTSGKYFMSKKRQPPTCGKSLILYYEESISKALYLEWNTFVPSSVQRSPIIFSSKLPLTSFACASFTSFTISANFRGTYIAAGSSKSKREQTNCNLFCFSP